MIETFFSPLSDEILFLLDPKGYKARLLQLLDLAAEPMLNIDSIFSTKSNHWLLGTSLCRANPSEEHKPLQRGKDIPGRKDLS